VQGNGIFDTDVNWSATGGTITSSGAFTPSSSGSAKINATSSEAPAISGSASFIVASSSQTPAITSIQASSPAITAGSAATVTADFINGVGVITPGNIPIASGTPVFLSPSVSTVYTLAVTSSIGIVATQTIAITVVPPPAIESFTPNNSIIASDTSASLTATFTNGTGIITPGNIIVTSGVPVAITPTNTTTYTLTVTNPAGNAATQMTTVTVTGAPTIISLAAASPTISAGTSTNLTAVFANTNGVITPGNITIQSGGAVPVSPATTTTYTLTVTNLLGVTTSKTVTVTVIPAPIINSFASNVAAITTGNSASLTATFSNGTGVITPGNIAVTSGTPVTVSPTTNTTYTLTVTNSVGSAVNKTATVTVGSAPAISSFVTSASTITTGSSANLTAIFSNGTGVITPGNISVTSSTPVSVYPSSTTIYTLTVTNPEGTSVTQTTTVAVDPAPTISSFIASPTSITTGNSASLTAIFSNGTGVITPGNIAVTSGTPVTVSPTSSTTYTLTVTNFAGTSVTSSATVAVGAAPAITSLSTDNSNITVGGSVNLTSIFVNGTGVITPGNISVTSGISVSVSPTSTTTYTLTVTNPENISVTQTVTITVDPVPTITSFYPDNTTITDGSSANLTAVFSNGTGIITPGNISVASGTAVSLSPTSTTTYTLTVTNSAGSSVTQTTSVTVVGAPSISSFTVDLSTITVGGSANLTPTFSNGTGVITPGNITATSGSAVNVTPTSTTTYTLTVTNSENTSVTQEITVIVDPMPSISSFTASSSTISYGNSTNLTGTFSNGTGVITPGNITVTSGTAVSVSPVVTTTYTLTVTNSAGTPTTVTSGGNQSVTITVNASNGSPVQLGINITPVSDQDPSQMFADLMKQARKPGSTATPTDESASVDSYGWPTQDAGISFLNGNMGTWSLGTYALQFTGQATVQADDPNVSVGTVTYNSATNISTATVTVSSGYSYLDLVFTNTQRTPTSAVGSGITNISLLRPTISGTPHAAGTLFTDRFLARLKYFTAIRAMQYLQILGSTEQVWTDRSIPAYASQQEEPSHTSQNVTSGTGSGYITGAAYEYAIQLANQTGKDLWVNIPLLAFGGTYQFTSTAWATDLALLLKYGSDATGNPYTGIYGSGGSNPQPLYGPVNPPLNPGIHIYLEWYNEFWANAPTWMLPEAQLAINAQDPDVDYDGSTVLYDVGYRIEAKGVMLMEQAFANVYGSANFGTVFRPIYSGYPGQLSSYDGFPYLDSQHGGANKYIWAADTEEYDDYAGDNGNNDLTNAEYISAWQSNQTNYVDVNLTEPYANGGSVAMNSYENFAGPLTAHEGGQWEITNTGSSILAVQLVPGMRGITTADIDAFYNAGAGTFFYYTLCAYNAFGLSDDISYDIDADTGYNVNPAISTETYPKWGAIKQIATTGR